MDVLLAGTGGPAGWPQPGCRCASCSLARSTGTARSPTEIVVDGVIRLTGPQPAGQPSAIAGPLRLATPVPAGWRAEVVPGGMEVTTPSGHRLLCAAGPGAVPLPGETAAPYDVVLLDMLGDPAQLGWLRRRRLVTDTTMVAVIHVDHRLGSEHELSRRCRFWRIAGAADGDRLADGDHVTAEGGQGARPAALRRPWRVLILGGAGSGKSAEAELRLAAEPEVTYVAAAPRPGPGDAEWSARVAAHQARRPSWWRTLENADVAAALRAPATAGGAVLVDSIGGWLTSVLDECGAWRRPPGDAAVARRVADRTAALLAAWRETSCHVIAASEEVGSGVVPDTPSGRTFRDELGRINQLLAAGSEETVLVVAGRALSLPG